MLPSEPALFLLASARSESTVSERTRASDSSRAAESRRASGVGTPVVEAPEGSEQLEQIETMIKTGQGPFIAVGAYLDLQPKANQRLDDTFTQRPGNSLVNLPKDVQGIKIDYKQLK